MNVAPALLYPGMAIALRSDMQRYRIKAGQVVRLAFLCGVSFVAAACGTESRNTDHSVPQPTTPAQQAALSEADPQMGTVLDALKKLNPKPIETLTPAEARRQPSAADAVVQVLQEKGDVTPQKLPPVGKVEMKTIAGPGGQIPVRIYSPKGDGPFPLVVYFHGGGWVLADLDTYDSSCRSLTSMANAVVVSVDYRRAPESKFPAAHEDCYAALQYVANHPSEFSGNSSGVAVVGESAGGNLATAVCLMAHQRNGKMPIHQILVYPIANYAFDTPSYRENAEAKPLNAAMMRWFFNQYLKSPADGASPLISPLRATTDDLKALPPATVITAEIDPLRSEGRAYAQKLKEAGVDVAAKDYTGVTHEFFGMGAVVDKAKDAEGFAAGRLKSAFAAAAKR